MNLKLMISGCMGKNFHLIPQEIPKVHCPDFCKERPYKDALDELVRILKELVPPLGIFHTSVPSLPPHFQPRRDIAR